MKLIRTRVYLASTCTQTTLASYEPSHHSAHTTSDDSSTDQYKKYINRQADIVKKAGSHHLPLIYCQTL